MNPVIDGIVISPPQVGASGSAVLTITAHDPDAKRYVVTGIARDPSGNEARANVVFDVSDPLTYEAVSEPPGLIFTSRAGQPGVFDVEAP